jgi:hypothetical protein
VLFLLAPFLLGGLEARGARVRRRMFDHGGLCESRRSAVAQQVGDASIMSIPMQPMLANNLAPVPRSHNHALRSRARFTPKVLRKLIVFNISSTAPTPNELW